MKNISTYKSFFCSILILLVAVVFAQPVIAKTLPQSYIQDSHIAVYLPKQDHQVESATVQWGNSIISDASVFNIGEGGSEVHTTILFDNSLSISDANRVKMKNLCKELFGNPTANEHFTLAIFDEESHVIMDNSTDYNACISGVDSIEFLNQDTYFNDVVYSALSEMVNRNDENNYQRLIVLSDGSNDQDVSYTYDEIKEKANQNNIPIYVIGSQYDRQLTELEQASALSRETQGTSYLLDKENDINTIVSDLVNEEPGLIIKSDIPNSIQDGETKVAEVALNTAEGVNKYSVEVKMPFGVVETEVETSASTERNTEEVTEKETESETQEETQKKEVVAELISTTDDETDKSSPRGLHVTSEFLLALIIISLAVIVLIIVLIIRGKHSNRIETNSFTGDRSGQLKDEYQPENRNDINYEPEAEEDDEGATVLVFGGDAAERSNSPVSNKNAQMEVVLTDLSDYHIQYKANCDQEILIGRKQECTITLAGDKSVSGKHCYIRKSKDGELELSDNGSSNGTYINGRKVEQLVSIKEGDVLEIGRSKFRIHIVEIKK